MKHRTYVSFEWDTPDDGELDAGGNVIAPRGRQVLEYVRSRLRQNSFEVTDVDLHETFGWSIDVVVGRVPVWCMIQYAEPWLIITEVPLPLVYWLCGRKPAEQHSRVYAAIHEVLTSGQRARTIRWFSQREYTEYNGSRGRAGVDRP
jgi:hypothetical protein